jgi:hypothetical protein
VEEAFHLLSKGKMAIAYVLADKVVFSKDKPLFLPLRIFCFYIRERAWSFRPAYFCPL